MNGDAATEALRAAGFTALIVIATGCSAEEDKARFLSVGADTVLVKPIKLEDIQNLLSAL
jgi:DNA-binding response OmpR family regulator